MKKESYVLDNRTSPFDYTAATFRCLRKASIETSKMSLFSIIPIYFIGSIKILTTIAFNLETNVYMKLISLH